MRRWSVVKMNKQIFFEYILIITRAERILFCPLVGLD